MTCIHGAERFFLGVDHGEKQRAEFIRGGMATDEFVEPIDRRRRRRSGNEVGGERGLNHRHQHACSGPLSGDVTEEERGATFRNLGKSEEIPRHHPTWLGMHRVTKNRDFTGLGDGMIRS